MTGSPRCTSTWQVCLVRTQSRVESFRRRRRTISGSPGSARALPNMAEIFVRRPAGHRPEIDHEFSAFVLGPTTTSTRSRAPWASQSSTRGPSSVAVSRRWSPDACVERHFRTFVRSREVPTGRAFSDAARKALLECIETIRTLRLDRRLVDFVEAEYKLFRLVERQLCQTEVTRTFRDVDDFLDTAGRIMNRRKSRAGRSLENHVDYLLSEARIPHTMRPRGVDGRPDIIIPGEEQYRQQSFPDDRLVVVGVKTTCKDRWRQVVREARRIPLKHILTIQQGISSAQLEEMRDAKVQLVVPEPLHVKFPVETRRHLLTVEGFIEKIRPLCS